MTAIEFVDELPGRAPTHPDDIADFAAELKLTPGKWAVYPWSAELAPRTRKSRASDINCGTAGASASLRTGFQAACRGGVLYVRYIGHGRRGRK